MTKATTPSGSTNRKEKRNNAKDAYPWDGLLALPGFSINAITTPITPRTVVPVAKIAKRLGVSSASVESSFILSLSAVGVSGDAEISIESVLEAVGKLTTGTDE
jgi:hypothetical protein